MIGYFSIDIEKEINTNGFHILKKSFNRKKIYPNKFPDFPDIDEIKIGKRYTIRLFVKQTLNGIEKIDSGVIDVMTRTNKDGKYSCEILTMLPDDFPLKKGDKVSLTRDEILYEQR